MDIQKSNDVLWSKDFIFVCLVALFSGICMDMLNAGLSPFANDMWSSKALGGYLTTTFNVGSIVMAFFSGRLIDARGRRRCLVFSGVLLGACTVPLALWPVPAVAMAVRVVQGIGKGLLTVSATAVVADIVSRSRMNEGITLYGLGATFSLAIGPVIAMALIADGSYPRMFYVCAAACFLSAVCGAGITYEKKRPGASPSAPEEPSSAAEYRGIWKMIEKAALPASLNFTVFFFSTASIPVFITVYAQEVLHLPGTKIGLFFPVAAAVMLLFRLFAGKIADRKGALYVLLPAHLMAVGMYVLLLYAAPKSYAGYLLAGAVYGVCNATVSPVLNAVAVVDSPRERGAAANACYGFMMDFGIMFASAIFGSVIDRAATPALGYQRVFYFSMAVCLFSCAMAATLFNNRARARRRAKNGVTIMEGDSGIS